MLPQLKVAKQEINPEYDSYIHKLETKNRALKQLNTKPPDIVQLEMRERGFSLYVNGANNAQMQFKQDPKIRDAKSAPSSRRRRRWVNKSVEIQTERAGIVKTTTPAFSREYSEDFEATNKAESSSDSDVSDCGAAQVMVHMSRLVEDSDDNSVLEVNADPFTAKDSSSTSKPKSKQMVLSLGDVVKLRESLTKDQKRSETADPDYSSSVESVSSETNSGRDSFDEKEPSDVEEDVQINSVEDLASEEEETELFKLSDSTVLEFDQPQDTNSVLPPPCSSRKVKNITTSKPKPEARPDSILETKRVLEAIASENALLASKTSQSPKSPIHKDSSYNSQSVPEANPITRPQMPNKCPETFSFLKTSQKPKSPILEDYSDNNKSVLETRPTPQPQTSDRHRPSNNHPDIVSSLNLPEQVAVSTSLNVSLSESTDLSSELFGLSSDPPSSERPDIRCETRILPERTLPKQENDSMPDNGLEKSAEPTDVPFPFVSSSNPNAANTRESLLLSRTLTDDDIGGVVSRIRLLSKRQQKKLLKMLTDIEESSSEGCLANEANVSTVRHKSADPTLQRSGESDVKTKTTSVVNEIPVAVSRHSTEGPPCFILQVMDNWGDSKFIGLTGIDFISPDGSVIPACKISISNQGISNASCQSLSVLLNGRNKTTKERNMWSCPLSACPFSISFQIARNTDVKSIRIWNYNRNLNDLSIGARKINLSVYEQVIFSGNLEKGCGNPVFNYSQLVDLTDEIRHLIQRNISTADEVMVDSQNQTGHCSRDEIEADPTIGESEIDAALSHRNGCAEKSEPCSAEGSRSVFSAINADEVFSQDQWSLYGQDSATNLEITENAASVNLEAQKYRFSPPKPSSVIQREENNDLSLLDESPMRKIELSRQQWREDNRLRQSFLSLDAFSQSHKGRISTAVEGDIFDEYMAEQKAKQRRIECDVAASPSGVCGPDQLSDDEFLIPTLPFGLVLTFHIMSTWGDRHYVGLTGLEIFTSEGNLANIKSISADPADINVLPEYDSDPRIVDNLLDGVNKTRDDTHMWLAPFFQGRDHTVTITFTVPTSIALLRIWNYNKSRIHSSRGVKLLHITLDDQSIFKGEIARASGVVAGGIEHFGDTILFTTDEEILDRIAVHDQVFQEELSQDLSLMDDFLDTARPPTGNKDESNLAAPTDDDPTVRPFTRATGDLAAAVLEVERMDRKITSAQPIETDEGVAVFSVEKIDIFITETWEEQGDYAGLTGLQFIGNNGESIHVDESWLQCFNAEIGDSDYNAPISRLIDGVNFSSEIESLWLSPFRGDQKPCISCQFPSPVLLTGIRVWNYNAPDETDKGVKRIAVNVNESEISPSEGFLLRRAPGGCFFDYAQDILFRELTPKDDLRPSLKDCDDLPCGFIFEFRLYNTWGDNYYIGLTGLELYDSSGLKIELCDNNIAAYPDSVNVLESVSNDLRTPDKLIDGFNGASAVEHCWVAPIIPHVLNRVFVIFDQPTQVSMIKLLNYSKTPSRGVRDFVLLVDQLLVFQGSLAKVDSVARGIIPTVDITLPHQTILFSTDSSLLKQEKRFLIGESNLEPVQMTNEPNSFSQGDSSIDNIAKQDLRPSTSVTQRQLKRL